MLYGINATDHNDLSGVDNATAPPAPQPAQSSENQTTKRVELDIMRSNVNRVQRSLDRLLDMFMATQLNSPTTYPPFEPSGFQPPPGFHPPLQPPPPD
ncbi:hypothetical protein PCANC_15804 [Puccinia coronata f. sp. avenae]|uniref:Uncharacterized protein n=1 Tax=Puccinia coronata f. sp. avenae TaxID=200324 RepID=A0A2N5UE01_9BASI|nr:hypothetical protein PCASD_20669 [Puccinia coronata f. sp. avenae]PLW35975.1 hypothetical protein PCANC_15804 [Puccinia coronata f. sp. avenae]